MATAFTVNARAGGDRGPDPGQQAAIEGIRARTGGNGDVPVMVGAGGSRAEALLNEAFNAIIAEGPTPAVTSAVENFLLKLQSLAQGQGGSMGAAGPPAGPPTQGPPPAPVAGGMPPGQPMV